MKKVFKKRTSKKRYEIYQLPEENDMNVYIILGFTKHQGTWYLERMDREKINFRIEEMQDNFFNQLITDFKKYGNYVG